MQDKVGKAVTDLVNYWNKSESYSKQEVDALIGSVSSMTIEVVASLPSSGISDTTIYWVGPDQETGLYDQYIHSNNTWIKTGDTSINLGDYLTTSDFNTAIGYYYTKTEINSLIADYYSHKHCANLPQPSTRQAVAAFSSTNCVRRLVSCLAIPKRLPVVTL